MGRAEVPEVIYVISKQKSRHMGRIKIFSSLASNTGVTPF